MKRFALLALLGHISAIQLNQRFIEDVDDDVFVMNKKGNMVEKSELAGEAKTETTQKTTGHMKGKQSMVQSKSDPIFGSTGINERDKLPIVTDEQRLEEDLKSRKPIDFELDPTQHADTQDSIEWAEKNLGGKMPTPPRELDHLAEKDIFHVEDFDDTEDGDIANTLKSAHQAEVALGYHEIHSHSYPVYNYTGVNSTNYNPYHFQTNDYAHDAPSEFNGTVAFHSDPEYYEKGFHTAKSEFDFKGKYENVYGSHDASVKEGKQDWWNHLVKVPYDGMASASILTKGASPTWGNSMDYEKLAMEAINERARYEGAQAARAKATAADKEVVAELDTQQSQAEAKEAEKKDEESRKPADAAPKGKKVETKKEEGGEGEAKEGGFVPPELDQAQAAVQKSAPKQQPQQQLQQSQSRGKSNTNTINIDGQDIPVGDMMLDTSELTQVDDMNLQQGEENIYEESFIMTNQQKLEQIMMSQ